MVRSNVKRKDALVSTHNELVQELTWLQSNGVCKLGGSRYFAMKYPDIIQVKKTTDWDFYAQDTTETRNALVNRGYYLAYSIDKDEYEGDTNLNQIYKHIEFPEIQVLLRYDVELYTKVIKSIEPEFYRDYLWKSGPNYCSRDQIQAIFNQLFETASL